MQKKIVSILLIFFSIALVHAQTNRYWVGASIYRNSLTSAGDLTEWTLRNDDGSGSLTTSAAGSSVLTTDNYAGGYSNQIASTIGGSPRLLMLDKIQGKVQLQVVALSIGTQFSIQVEEYTAGNVLLGTIDILPWQSNAGLYTVALSSFGFNAAATKVRFIISAKNIQSLQGSTVELNYFNYYNTDNTWSNAANWSATSGGAGGAGVPGTLDQAIFDGNSATNAIVNQITTIKNLSLTSAYKSGLVNTSGFDFTVTGTSQLSGGFIYGVSDHVFVTDVTWAGTQYASSSGIITVKGLFNYVSGNFKPVNGKVVFVSSATQLIPALDFYNLTFNGTGTKIATGNFSVAGNLVNNSTFNAAGNAVVFKGVGAQSVSGSLPITFHHVSITNSSNAGLTLSTPVKITGVLTLAENAHLNTGNDLTLVATSPTVTASIAALTGTMVISGNVKVQKYIYSPKRIYRYLTSPVTSATVADWQSSITITGTFSDPSTGAGIGSTTPSLFEYNESIPGINDNGYVGYPASGPASAAPLVPGKGYSIYVRDNAGRPTVLEVSGTINRGTVNISSLISFTPTAAGPWQDGWSLVGNPYPSSIDWTQVAKADRKGIDNAIYYRDNNSASPVYRSWVGGVGTNATNGVISSSQAFWVKANGTETPVVRLKEIHKSAVTASFYRTGNDLALLRISLDSTSDTFQDETVIRLTDEATTEFDSEYDAYKLFDAAHPAIGSSTDGSPLLSINALAEHVSTTDTLSLFVQTVTEGSFKLSVPEYTFDPSITAYLWDTYTHVKKQLLEGSTYPFVVSADSAGKTNRFKILLYREGLTTGVFTSSSKSAVFVFPNPVDRDKSRSITIRCPETPNQIASIELYDVTGALVFSEHQVAGIQSDYMLTLPQTLTNGIYKLRIAVAGNITSSTLVLK